MQNCLVPSPYPEKLVPPCVMNYTTSLYDILAYIQCDFVDGVLTLNYINN